VNRQRHIDVLVRDIRVLAQVKRIERLALIGASRELSRLKNKGFVNDIGCDGFPIDDNHPFNRTMKIIHSTKNDE
jgi:uncharacterized lipoprotein YajG